MLIRISRIGLLPSQPFINSIFHFITVDVATSEVLHNTPTLTEKQNASLTEKSQAKEPNLLRIPRIFGM
jgi:hypothetical protein